MLDPEQTRERVLIYQRLRELTAARIEQEAANQRLMWKLLEEKNQATIDRLIASKIPDKIRTA